METKKEYVNYDLQDIWPIVLVFVITGIGVAYGLDVMGSATTTLTGNAASAAANATQGITNLTSKLPVLGLIVAAALLIGILMRNFGAMGSK